MMTPKFLDTSYAIALSAQTDKYHRRALTLADQLEQAQCSLVTTRAVVVEVGNALSRLRYRTAAIVLLDAIEHDPMIEIIPLTDDLFAQAYQLFRTRPDKEWGLTDCMSFVVMEQLEITEALTADHHFRQAGFHPLLLAP